LSRWDSFPAVPVGMIILDVSHKQGIL